TAAPDAGVEVESGNVLTGHASDAETDTLSVSAVSGASLVGGAFVVDGTHGTLTVSADGHYSFAANSAFDALTAADHVQDQFTFTVSDGNGGAVDNTLTINIAGTNDTPVVTAVTDGAADTAAPDAGVEVAS